MKWNKLNPCPEIEKVLASFSIQGIPGYYSCDFDPDLACATKYEGKDSIVVCRPLLEKLDDIYFEWIILHEYAHIINNDMDYYRDNLSDAIKFQHEVAADKKGSELQFCKRGKNYGIFTLKKMILVLDEFKNMHFLSVNAYLSRKMALDERIIKLRSYKDIYSRDINISI